MIPNLSKPEISWNFNKKIFTKYDAIPLDVCDQLIDYGNSHVIPGVDKYPHLFKTSFHSCLLPLNHHVHSLLENVWQEIVDHFKFSIMFVEPYELKRYKNDDFFGSHIDNYYSLNQNIDRKITMVLQLSDDTLYTGGELKIVNKVAPKNKGSITAFPSFFPHEVSKTEGCRWSLIGWAWGPYWR